MRIYFISIMILTVQALSATHLLANFESKKIKDDMCQGASPMSPAESCQSDADCSVDAPANGIFCNTSPRYNCPGTPDVCWFNESKN